MYKSINDTCYSENTSNNSTDLDKEVENVLLVLPVSDSNRRKVESEVNSGQHIGNNFIAIASKLMHVVFWLIDILIGGGNDLKINFIIYL